MGWRIALWALAIVAAVLPRSGPFVERWYSNGLFPWVQRLLTTVSNVVPLALFDVLLVTVAGGVLLATLFDVSRCGGARPRGERPERSVLGALFVRLTTVVAVAYLAFLVCWGLNYRRPPITTRVTFDESRVTVEGARRLAQASVQRVNALYQAAHADAWPALGEVDPALAAAFTATQAQLGVARPYVPARPKTSLLDLYFRRVGVAGMTDPYFLETLVASDLLTIERPVVIAHEWSHLAGLADEGEANFAGFLTCLRGGALHQYSAWLFLYGEVMSGLSPADARGIAERLDEGPRADLLAIRDRILRQVSPTARAAGWRVYDRYLKANRVEEGTSSYGEVTRLVLGTEGQRLW